MLSVLGFSALTNAEIVTNSKGDKVELKDNGTWSIVKLTNEDYVLNMEYYDIKLKDGNGNEVTVKVSPSINQKDGKKLTRDRALFGIKMTEIPISYELKNRYSYVPKRIYIDQDGNSVRIKIEYTAKNSYGAETIGTYHRDFTMDQKGDINLVRERI